MMIEHRLAQAIQHRESAQFDEAEAILLALLADLPDDPQVNFQMAWLCDTQGKESEAVPYYEQAIAQGLAGEDLRGAMLGLGSTYRCLGQYDRAVDMLRAGMERFPEAGEFAVFLAMALYNTGQHTEAMTLLLSTLVKSTHDDGIKAYRNAILFYHDKLDQTW